MQMTQPHRICGALSVVRWGARILSVLILLFWGLFTIAHLVGDEGSPSRPLVWSDYAMLTGLVVSLVGLATAWKWELPGAVVSLAAVSMVAVLNWRVVLFPGTLIPITAMMFLICEWMSRGTRKRPDAGNVAHVTCVCAERPHPPT